MSNLAAEVTPEVLQAFADAWNRHDADALMSFMTEDCVFESSAGPDVSGTRYVGRDAVRAGYAEVWSTFPDAHWGGARHFVQGERGVSEWTFTGTRADGTRVEVNGCDLFTFRGGKIAVKNSYRKNRSPVTSAKTVLLETRSLLLRKFVPEDAAAVFTQSNEDAARTWLPSQVCRDQAHAHSVLEFLIGQYSTPGSPKDGPYVLAIEHRADRVLIGHVGFSPLDDEVEIGYAITQGYQGRGLGTEAVATASRWGLQTFGLEQLLGIASAANTASRRVLTRAGFAHLRDETKSNQGTEQMTSVYVLSSGQAITTEASRL